MASLNEFRKLSIKNPLSVFRAMLVAVLLLALNACVGVATNTSTLAVKASKRDELQPLAEAGDAAAQYELGLSHCCMGPGFDTQTATEWLCRAARQENTDAMFELGRIYSGDVSRTPAPGQKLMKALRARDSAPHAWLWLNLAAERGHEEAGAKRDAMAGDMSADDLRAADAMRADWALLPCEYRDVFPDSEP